MSSNDCSGPPERGARKKPAKAQGNTDLHVRRTRERFGAALIALIEEKAIHEVMIRGSARSRQRSAAPLLSSLSK
jgi:hypothetical protein